MRFWGPWLLVAACSEPAGLVQNLDPLSEDTDEVEEEPTDPRAPVAEAGEDFRAYPLRLVRLDGSRSYDPGGLGIIPTWTLVDVPSGSQAWLERADTMSPEFFADVAGAYVVRLDVVNEAGLPDASPDFVEVQVVPGQAVYVQLTWDAEVDLDLHLRPEDEVLWGSRDCSWCNLNPPWGRDGLSTDDPSLDIDSLDGSGPETITVMAPSNGGMIAAVDYYGQQGHVRCKVDPCPPTRARVDLYVDGELSYSLSRELRKAGEVWELFALDWPSGQVSVLNQMGRTERDGCR